MGKNQRRAAGFSFLCALSMMLGQIAKTSYTDAPVIAYFAGFIFSILAFINAYKAYESR